MSQSLRSLKRIQSLLKSHSLHSRHFQRPNTKGNKTGRECEKNLREGNKTGRECEI